MANAGLKRRTEECTSRISEKHEKDSPAEREWDDGWAKVIEVIRGSLMRKRELVGSVERAFWCLGVKQHCQVSQKSAPFCP